MNNYFANITKHLNLKPRTASNTMDTEQITSAFNNQVTIKKTRDAFLEIRSNNFEFTKVTEENVKNEVLKLNTKKSSTSGSIPATILKHTRKNVFACLFSLHNTISLSRHEQVCLMRLRFERYFFHHRAM